MFTVVIPTYKRPEDLSRALASILSQTMKPASVLIIDDADTSEEFLNLYTCKLKSVGVDLQYYKKDHAIERRGLSESKNKALDLVKTDLIIIDDDIELDNLFIEKITQAWREFDDPKLIGVGGMIINNRRQGKLEKFFHRFYHLNSATSWDVTPEGFQVWDESINKAEKAYYVHGGLCALRLELARELGFTAFSGGRTALEDVDFCLRAKQAGYHFVMQPHAKAVHHVSREHENAFLIGKKETINRRDIFRRIGSGDRKEFLWQLKGWMERQFLSGHFKKFAGMVVGLFTRL